MSKRDNLYLVGLMGAGKTTVGRLLAKHYGCVFHDSDHEIEARTGVKIPVIFEIEGEAGFRKREAAAIAELTALNGIVLATGGGAILAQANREALRRNGVVIYLRGTPEHLYERTRHDRNRPLLQTGNPLEKLRELHRQRDPLYREVADIVVDTGRQSVSGMTRILFGKLDLLRSSLPLADADV
ncbi:shikimate kinase [Betaproteobacteria bacterium SCN1]|jgi:shikimate kinase|nr:shikimate kinase [Betaproteobacteria bacterium SCN1]